MHLCDLPDDVVRLVLEASLKTSRGIVPTLKANLPLLAVCRRWRHLARAAVYSSMLISYSNKPRRGSYSDDNHANNPGDEPDNAAITTNLDLVTSAGCAQMVKRMRIVVNYRANPLPRLGAAIRLLRAAAEEWNGVSQLDISVTSAERMLADGVNAADHRDTIKQASAALAAVMPNVYRVSFDGHYSNSIVREFDGQLAVLYSDRLESLLSNHPITVPRHRTLMQIKKVSIWYGDSIGYQHPGVNPAKLVSLELTLWPLDHSWAPFSANGDSREIEFPNLKRLGVIYRPTDVADGVEVQRRDHHPWKLHFPKLDSLYVNCEQAMCPLLGYAVLPPRMKKISIEATAPILACMAEMRLPTTQRIKISIIHNSNGSPAALAAANRILNESTVAELGVRDRSLPVLPESITCASLTALSVRADTSVDTMLGLIRTIPSLTDLYVWTLTLSNIQEDVSVPGPDEACLVKPLSSKIKKLVVDASPDEPAPEMIVPVAKYLLLRIPTLAEFDLGSIPEKPIAEFVDAYSKRYPHLAGIKYKLGNS